MSSDIVYLRYKFPLASVQQQQVSNSEYIQDSQLEITVHPLTRDSHLSHMQNTIILLSEITKISSCYSV